MSSRYGALSDQQADIEELTEALNKDLEFIRIELQGIPLSVEYATHVVREHPGAAETEVFSYLIFYRYEEAGEDDA
jgi:hypothetical protein